MLRDTDHECEVCQARVIGSFKLVHIIDIDEYWCENCTRHGYLVGDQELCRPATVCDSCECWYTSKGIKHKDEDTGLVSCIDCFDSSVRAPFAQQGCGNEVSRYTHRIFNMKDVPRDGKCWRLIICKDEIRPGSNIPYAVSVFSGDYTAKIGAERAAKRRLKKLNKNREKDVIQA